MANLFQHLRRVEGRQQFLGELKQREDKHKSQGKILGPM